MIGARQAQRPGRKGTTLNTHDDDTQETSSSTKTRTTAQLPSSEQMKATRSAHWHQDGKPLLSVGDLREWVNRCGLVAYGPRVQQMGAPAASIVEATLGKKLDAAAEVSEGDAARSLVARLVAEGNAVPLNLLGAAGGMGTDVPDYVASAAVFSYVFTLRGNKAWKLPPVTTGAVKVSPLALATYEMLQAKETLSAYDLATQLGKEVTESAVLRSLTELWSQLRVIPVPRADGTATLWELTQSRFTKQIKAGANAGQPSALSALITLYLGQAVAATEDEIETFLSPLAPRSRVRDVIHALLAARQLETVVVEGKTLLHVTGELPAFAAASVLETTEEEATGETPESSSAVAPRISKFVPKPGSKIGTGLRSKPAFAKKPGFGSKPSFGAKPAFGDRERRPFKRDDKPAFAKPRFDKPWAEKPRARPAGEGFAPKVEGAEESRPPRREYIPRPSSDRPSAGPRKTFSKPGTFTRKREGVGGKPGFGTDRGEGRPPRRESGSDSRPPRRDFAERPERPSGAGFKRASASAGSYAPRPKPSFGGERAGAERSGGKPAFGRKPFGDKPAFGAKPTFRKDAGGDEAPRKTFRKFDAPREKKPFGAKPSGARPARSFDGPRPERPRSEGRPAFGSKPAFPGKSDTFGVKNREGDGPKKPFKRAAGFAGAGGPFAKFADGKKPFRKPGKPAGAPKKSTGDGYRPTKRRAE